MEVKSEKPLSVQWLPRNCLETDTSIVVETVAIERGRKETSTSTYYLGALSEASPEKRGAYRLYWGRVVQLQYLAEEQMLFDIIMLAIQQTASHQPIPLSVERSGVWRR